MRLFCFPYAGGGAAVFRQWSSLLPEGVDLCPIEIPGRGKRFGEPLFKRLVPLVIEVTEALGPFLDRPFAFFGHSMGGLIAFELTRHLRRRGKELPEFLFISASEPPHRLKPRDRITYQLPDAEFLKELERLGGTPPEVLKHRELIELFLPVVRADIEIMETYRYSEEAPLSMTTVVFGGEQDSEVSLNDLQGWRDQTSGSFHLHPLPGDHFFIKTAQDNLLTLISDHLHQRNL